MKSLAYVVGNAIGGAAVIFVEALILTFIIKRMVIAFAKEERKAVIEQNFSILKTSLVYGAAAIVLTIIGMNSHSIGYYSIPVIVVVDLILANSK